MKIYKLNGSEKMDVETNLSYQEMIAKEGIYKVANDLTGDRIIILEGGCHLFFDGQDIDKLQESIWTSHRFVKVNEKMYLEIK